MVATRTLDDLLGRSLFNGVRGTVILRTKIFKSISIQVDLAFFLSRYWGGLNNAIVYIYIYKYPLQKCGEPRDTPNRHLTLSVIFFIVRKNMTSGACDPPPPTPVKSCKYHQKSQVNIFGLLLSCSTHKFLHFITYHSTGTYKLINPMNFYFIH